MGNSVRYISKLQCLLVKSNDTILSFDCCFVRLMQTAYLEYMFTNQRLIDTHPLVLRVTFLTYVINPGVGKKP